MNKLVIAALTVLGLNSCFEYNPNQIILDDEESGLTQKNITRIQSRPAPAVIKFAFMGDTQRFYDEAEEFVDHINTRTDIDFVIHAGDISDFGLAKEFIWVNDIMSKIRVPHLTVVGNHDLLANGRKVYNEMYGDLNYSFEYGNYKFIMLNTNSREYDFKGTIPDLIWLQNQLAENTDNKKVIVISHVPPFDVDFDKNLEQDYARILATDPNVIFSLHGHRHSFYSGEYYDDGVDYFITTSTQKKGYAVITLTTDGESIEKIEF